MLTIRFDTRLIVLIGMMLVIVGAFLPWINLPTFLGGALAQRGLAGGGFLTLALGILGLVSLLLPWRFLRLTALPAAGLALVSTMVALAALAYVIWNLFSLSLNPGAYPHAIGSGLYMTFAGNLVALVGGLWPAHLAPATATPPSPTANSGRRLRLELLIPAALIGLLASVCLCAVLASVLIGPIRTILKASAPAPTTQPSPQPFPAELWVTPLVDVQVTLWQVTPAPTSSTPKALPTAPPPTPRPHTPTPSPSPTKLTPTLPGTVTPTLRGTVTSTPVRTSTPTPPHSPLDTPVSGFK